MFNIDRLALIPPFRPANNGVKKYRKIGINVFLPNDGVLMSGCRFETQAPSSRSGYRECQIYSKEFFPPDKDFFIPLPN